MGNDSKMTVDAAVAVVAGQMLRRYASEYNADHLTWEDFIEPAREDVAAATPFIVADALDRAAADIVIPGASSLAAAWLQGCASKFRSSAGRDPRG